MGYGEAIRSVGRIAWLGQSGLNNAKPRSEGRQPGPGNPSEAKTPAEALSHIELLYQSGRMEDLGKLLKKSQVFRAAWLILQRSSPDLSEAAGEGKGASEGVENGRPTYLPVPYSGPTRPALEPGPGSPGPKEAGRANNEFSPQITAAGIASDGGHDFFVTRSQAAHPLSLLLQVYLNQDGYWARERQRGQLVSIQA
jgi:hypothetical protein